MRIKHSIVAVLVVCFSAVTISSDAQETTVKRGSNVRHAPSSTSNIEGHLSKGETITVGSVPATNGYLSVRTSAGIQGWVLAKNVTLLEAKRATAHATIPTPTMAMRATLAAPGKVGPAALYPDHTKSPGDAATLNAADLTKRYPTGCHKQAPPCTYSDSHRDVSGSLHRAIYEEYNAPQNLRNKTGGEVDHIYPLCAGGSNKQENLWFQPADNKWNGKNFGYHEKDALETWVCTSIKAGKLEPQEAFDRLTTDWVKWYIELGLNTKDGVNDDADQ